MAETKITEDQLNKIHDFQKEIRTLLVDVGVKEAEKHAAQTEEQAELKRLRKELQRVTEERDILKKAAAYFAKQSD